MGARGEPLVPELAALGRAGCSAAIPDVGCGEEPRFRWHWPNGSHTIGRSRRHRLGMKQRSAAPAKPASRWPTPVYRL